MPSFGQETARQKERETERKRGRWRQGIGL